jgi:Tfp pilus assembly protein PilV
MLKVRSIIKPPSQEAGFSPIEVLLAATIFGMLVTVLVGAIIFGRESIATAGDRARAAQLAEEGVEAVRNIRDASYANLADGTYGLAQSGGVWTLSGASDTTDIYNRQITIATVDSKRKTVTSNVTWPQRVGTASASVTARLTGWATAVKSWLNAVQAGSYNALGTGDGVKVATAGNYAYMVRNGSPNFVIVNISSPASPTLVSAIDVANTPTNIAVSGTHAYITTSSNSAELQILDISNPASPSVNASYNASGNANGLSVAVSGNYAYLTRAANGGNHDEFVVINVAVPTAPVRVGAYSNNISLNDVVVSGNYAYVGTSSNSQELMFLNISNPASPTLAASMDLPGSGSVLAVSKFSNTLFVGRTTTLRAINVTNPLAASALGTVTTTGTATVNDVSLDSTGAYAFLGTNSANAEFQIADITNPASMSIVRTVDVSPGTNSVNGVAYSSSLDTVVGVTASDTQEAVTFVKN